MVAGVEIGFYGKLPGRADFVVHGLSESFLTPFSEWIERCLAAGRSVLGPHWSDAYLTSPVWHFALSTGLAGRQTMLGAMTPSTDRAGRDFPFIVAASVDSDLPVAALAMAAGTWPGLAAELAAAAVTRSLDPAQLQVQIAALGRAWPALPNPVRVTSDKGEWRASGAGDLNAAMPLILDHAAASLGRPSLWWTDGSAQMPPSTFLCGGLPEPSRFPAMIDGRWKK